VFPGTRGLGELPQWLEYNLRHVVDHFLVYTMTGTDERVMDIYKPYLDDGLATRVHLEIPRNSTGSDREYKAESYSTQAWFANDCLYRMKNHAKWMSPTIDVDEYFRLVHSTQVQDTMLSAKSNYGASPWDGFESDWKDNNLDWKDNLGGPILRTDNLNVHSLSFSRYLYLRAPAGGALQISSSMRQETLAQKCPKYVVNPALVNALFIHWPTSWVAGSVGLSVPPILGVGNHYRLTDSSTAKATDWALAAEVPAVTEAIEARFQSTWESLSTKLASGTWKQMTLMSAATQQKEFASLEDQLSMEFTDWINDVNKRDQIEILVPPSVDPRALQGRR